MITAKIHKRGNETILAACDTELIGKKLTNKFGAEIFINPNFYQGVEITAEDLLVELKSCTSANLFGKETIKACKEQISKIIDCNGTPHAQIVKII